jgi:hypothetical protein
MRESHGHVFRPAHPDERVFREVERGLAKRHTAEYERHAEYRRHKYVIEDALMRRLLGDAAPDREVAISLAALKDSLPSRKIAVRDGVMNGPPVIHVNPGLNIVGPPYDFALNVALGKNAPSIQNDVSSGRFGVVVNSHGNSDSFGTAGNSVFVVPSAPGRTLVVRPYFEWNYVFSCETHGPPTAHAQASITADMSGHSGSATRGFPGHATQLFRGSSDGWDDDSGNDSGIVTGLEFQMVGSNSEFYLLSFGCQASVDSHENIFGWSMAQVQLHCRVPFFFIEEF